MHLRPLTTLLVLCLTAPLLAGNWPQWRGPNGDGVSHERNLPAQWDEKLNMTWKVAMPGPGNGSPIVWGDRVFVTATLDKGARRALLCFDRDSGRLLWQQSVDADPNEPTHQTSPYSATTPCTDGEAVYVWHGTPGLIAYDFAGREQWKLDLGRYRHIWGMGPSPVLFEDMLIVHAGPGDNVKLVAVQKKTGTIVWEKPLPEAQNTYTTPGDKEQWKGSWSTPVIARHGDRAELILTMPNHVVGFNPQTGTEYWRCGGLGDLVYTTPLIGEDVIVAMSGYGGPDMGMKLPDGAASGDLTATHQLWRHDRTTQRIGSGVLVGGRVYLCNDNGSMQCIDAKTGEDVYKERLTKKSWGSMIYADQRLYVTDMQGVTHVVKPGPTFEVLASNPVGKGETCRSTPAFSDGQVFIRTYEHLHCIGVRLK